MGKDTADIFGITKSGFTFTIDAGNIAAGQGGATLVVDGQADLDLNVSGNGREVTVPSLPKGDSVVFLALVWTPTDNGKDAAIDVGTVSSGKVTVANPKHTIDFGKVAGTVALWGGDAI